MLGQLAWMTVEQLSKELEDDSTVAEEKYTGRPVKVSGAIRNIGGDLGGSTVVQIINGGDVLDLTAFLAVIRQETPEESFTKKCQLPLLGLSIPLNSECP